MFAYNHLALGNFCEIYKKVVSIKDLNAGPPENGAENLLLWIQSYKFAHKSKNLPPKKIVIASGFET